MINYWPALNPAKELLFLNELEEILDLISTESLITIQNGEILVNQIAKVINRCMKSEHYQVAERALLLWNNDKLSGILKSNPFKEQVYPIIIGSLVHNAKLHWHP